MATDSPVVIDTNVLVVANNRVTPQATPECVVECVKFLREVEREGHVVVDDRYLIIREYMRNVDSTGQPGVGDAFLKWVLTNLMSDKHCTCVPITPDPIQEFLEFPDDPALIGFDRADRMFVAVALVHPDRPDIANAVDSDWEDFREALEANGVHVRQLCSVTPRVRGRNRG